MALFEVGQRGTLTNSHVGFRVLDVTAGRYRIQTDTGFETDILASELEENAKPIPVKKVSVKDLLGLCD